MIKLARPSLCVHGAMSRLYYMGAWIIIMRAFGLAGEVMVSNSVLS